MAYNVKGEQRNTGKTHFKNGFTPWNKGNTGIYSEEYRRKIGDATRERLLNNHPQTNKSRTSEERKKISIGVQEFFKNAIGNMVGYPEDWKELTEKIFKRDKYLCQECGCKLERVRGKGQIQCHHIDYDTSNNDFSNLITLCASCHGKTSYRREDWLIHYRSKMKGK